jgi:hypothetical protein
MRVAVKLTLKVGGVAYPWFLGDFSRSEDSTSSGLSPHWVSNDDVIRAEAPVRERAVVAVLSR